MSSNKRDVKTNHGIKYGLLVGWITINSSITHLKFNRSTPFDLKKDPFFLQLFYTRRIHAFEYIYLYLIIWLILIDFHVAP